MRSLKDLKKNKISIEDIRSFYRIDNYIDLSDKIKDCILKKVISPIKASGLNGKKPALYNMYRLIRNETPADEYQTELNYELYSSFHIDYYRNHISQYLQDREDIKLLNQYIKSRKGTIEDRLSVNERSFEIWAKEKYLSHGGGKQILNNLSYPLENLNVYETREPLAYYSHHKNFPQNILILENKDTFYSMRRHLLQSDAKDGNTILGISIGTLVYGRGKGIVKAFEDFSLCAEPYLLEPDNSVLYLGDIDYEGIIIYESFYKKYMHKYSIKPFAEGYIRMLNKAQGYDLPLMKEGQNANIDNYFLDAFQEEVQNKVKEILHEGRYIPQEILNIKDF